MVLGKEFENTDNELILSAIKIMQQQGGEVEFHAGLINYATSDLLIDSTILWL